MSLISRQLSGGIKQLHRSLAGDTDCTIAGRSFKPVNGRRSYEKRQSDAGFIANVDSIFDALNADIVGVNIRQTVGKIMTYKGESFVVRRPEEGELTTLFYCEAKNV